MYGFFQLLLPPQPIGRQTLTGAIHRVQQLRQRSGEEGVDFYVGIEGGIGEILGCWVAFGAVVVENREGRRGIGISPLFQIPQWWVDRLCRGEELGHLVDEIAGRTHTKYDLGAIGVLTNGDMDRTELYVHGVRVALIPFLHPEEAFSSPLPL